MPESQDLILVGVVQKPYGLLGELKVKPESFDFERHKQLKKVYFRKRHGTVIETLTVRETRADNRYWYLKLDNLKTPEAVAYLSGYELCVSPEERLALPEGMVYFSDLPGMDVVDENGKKAGTIVEVMETGVLEFLVTRTSKGDIPIPWNDRFVKRIDTLSKIVEVDLSSLRGTLL